MRRGMENWDVGVAVALILFGAIGWVVLKCSDADYDTLPSEPNVWTGGSFSEGVGCYLTDEITYIQTFTYNTNTLKLTVLDPNYLTDESIERIAAFATKQAQESNEPVVDGIDIVAPNNPNFIDPNESLDIADFISDLSLTGRAYTSITICVDDSNDVTITWQDGKLDIVGDPNHYTKAARLFLTYAMADAAEQIVAANPEAIRRLADSGRICAVFGHQWRDGRPGEGEDSQYADYHPGVFYRTCRLCEKCETQSLTNWE